MGVRRSPSVFLLLTAAAALGAAGCGGHRTLETKSAAVPAGINFSGRWRLREDNAGSEREIARSGVEAAGGPAVLVPPEHTPIQAHSKRRHGTLVHVFLTTGKSLKISQTDAGLFISFDRAIVEEYRFGENREIHVGEAVAQRASGWEGDAYIIETLDDDDALMTETYRLGDGGTTLVRTITIIRGNDTQLDVRQTFDRV
jgi:hypothetical protein